MGKASRRKAGAAGGDDSGRDRKRISQAIRRLGLIDSRMPADLWAAQAEAKVGADDLATWDALVVDEKDDLYDFTYSTVDRALTLAVGFRSWPLEVECAWMLPRLRHALAEHDGEDRFLVEVGAGPGAAAAVLSAALGVPILCLDPHPLSAGLPEQLAERTGGAVTSHMAGTADIGRVLDGRVPAAVYGMGVFRYFQPHNHKPVFSYATHMNAILARGHAEPAALEFYEAIQGADLVLSEMSCPDYVAEVAAGAQRSGYHVPAGGLTQLAGATPNGPTQTTGMHFTRAGTAAESHLLVENYSPLPQPNAGLDLPNTPQAEALRWSLGDRLQSLDLTEVGYAKGGRVVRRELFRYGGLFGQYSADNAGNRGIVFVSGEEWPEVSTFVREQQEAMVAAGDISVMPLEQTPLTW